MEKHVTPMKRKCILKLWIIHILAGIAISSMAAFVIFTFTNTFDNAILSSLELKNGTSVFTWWERPPVRPIYKIRIFNYSNVEDFQSGKDSKLRVEEVGPYVYRETLSRVNVKLHENGTASYQEKRSFQWEGGSSDDEKIEIPNIMLLTTLAFTRDKSYLAQLSVTTLLSSLRVKTFNSLTVRDFLWGYDDEIYNMVKHIITLQYGSALEKFGLLATKTGVSKDRITIDTGSKGDLRNLGVYQRFNGMKSRPIWGDEKCDRIEGTDGSMFPPQLVKDRNATLQIYVKDMCRAIPLKLHGHGNALGIPTLRYKLPADVFTSSDTKDSCFCTKISKDEEASSAKKCPPVGIFNVSSCNFGAPMLISLPHFYLAEKSVSTNIDGLNPSKELHETYMDLHPRLGIPIGGWSRFQINIEVRKAIGVPFIGKLKDGTILPLMWMEVGIDEMPEQLLSLLQHAYFTARVVEGILQWGSLICLFLSLTTILIMLQKKKAQQQPLHRLQRNVSGQDRLLG
ncbi:lysosome membrane protein 2-like isoform X1 [Cephus cinctus]|uniref:Scavenger receptor class B member 1 n=1 Tax=Cephus cinctus TaxID=211228 RepID=A0AAJ7C5B3_CEPCN|nr:lysosome membrane protein 2-like isoform X1 [Cephus cinctus]XP_024944731.1 lysosome membrane protein 2-like isoform X1 [Cephus cinctus]